MHRARERRLGRLVARATWPDRSAAYHRARLRALAAVGKIIRGDLAAMGIDRSRAKTLRGADEAVAELTAIPNSPLCGAPTGNCSPPTRRRDIRMPARTATSSSGLPSAITAANYPTPISRVPQWRRSTPGALPGGADNPQPANLQPKREFLLQICCRCSKRNLTDQSMVVSMLGAGDG